MEAESGIARVARNRQVGWVVALSLLAALVLLWAWGDPGQEGAGRERSSSAPTGAARGEAGQEAALGARPRDPLPSIDSHRNALADTPPVGEVDTTGEVPAGPGTSASSVSQIRVRFLDSLGGPIAGAQVRVVSSVLAVGPTAGIGEERAGISAGDGRAQLALDWEDPQSDEAWIAVEGGGAGLAPERRRVRVQRGGTTSLGDWVLRGSGQVMGTVLDSTGRGLTGASIARLDTAQLGPGWEARRSLPLEELAIGGATSLSESDGSFALEGLPAGAVRLVAVLDGWLAGISGPLEVRVGEWLGEVEIRMEPGAGKSAVRGRVLDPDGNGVPFARVHMRGQRGASDGYADEDGGFELSVTGDSCEITAFHPVGRYREARLQGVQPGSRGLVLQLLEAPTFDLAVVSEDGDPIERFSVKVTSAEDGLLLSGGDADRSDGVAVLPVPGRDFRLEVSSQGWANARLGPFSSQTPPTSLECTMHPAGALLGVVELDGQPCPGAWVAVFEAVERETFNNGLPVRRRSLPANSTTSSTDGTFRLSVDEPGSYYVRAELDGRSPLEVGPLALRPGGGHRERLVIGQGGGIQVTVRSPGGAPAAGAIVGITRGDGLGATFRADEHGSLRVDQLMPGRWWVGLMQAEIPPGDVGTSTKRRTPAEIPWTCEVAAGQVTQVDLVVDERRPEGCRLSGRLIVDGQPAESWMARLDFEGEASSPPSPFAEPGRFELESSQAGEHRLNLMTATPVPSEMLVILDPLVLVEGDTEWSLSFDTGAIEGTLLLPEEPGPGLLFFLWTRGELRCLAPIVPDAEGRFHCDRVPAGPGRIVRYDPGRGIDESRPEVLYELKVEPGKTASVQVP